MWKVIIADDEKLICRLIETLIDWKALDMEIVGKAENGLEALEKMKQAAPGDYDLIIMDLQMPVLDGWQSAAAIRALPDTILARIPIVALSANVLADDQRKSRESGIDAHLTKPMDLPVLLDTIEALTGYRLGDCGG